MAWEDYRTQSKWAPSGYPTTWVSGGAYNACFPSTPDSLVSEVSGDFPGLSLFAEPWQDGTKIFTAVRFTIVATGATQWASFHVSGENGYVLDVFDLLGASTVSYDGICDLTTIVYSGTLDNAAAITDLDYTIGGVATAKITQLEFWTDTPSFFWKNFLGQEESL